jgi:hypothetical protein
MIESTFDLYLLHIIQIEFINQLNFINHFEVINIQTDDTLILTNNDFAELEEKKLAQVALTFK